MLRQLLFFLLIVVEGQILNGEPVKINLPFLPQGGFGTKFLFSNYFGRNHPKHESKDVSYSSDKMNTGSLSNDSDSMMVSGNETSSSWPRSEPRRNTKHTTTRRRRSYLTSFLNVLFPGVYVDVNGKLIKRTRLRFLKTSKPKELQSNHTATAMGLLEHFIEPREQSENRTHKEKNFKFRAQQYKCIWKNLKTRAIQFFSQIRGFMNLIKRRMGTVKENGAVKKEKEIV